MKRRRKIFNFTILITISTVSAAQLGDDLPMPDLFSQTFPAFSQMGGEIAEASGLPEYLVEVGLVEATPTPRPIEAQTPTAIVPPTVLPTATPLATIEPTASPTVAITPTATQTKVPTLLPTMEPTATATAQSTPTPAMAPTATQQPTPDKSLTGLGYLEDGQWVVGKDATMTKIAQHLGIDINLFIHANPHIANPNIIFSEQRLNLP